MADNKDYDQWGERCRCCGCFLKIEGAWVGDSHFDESANAICNNKRCRSNKKNSKE